jgi:ZIP family zinc transporter
LEPGELPWLIIPGLATGIGGIGLLLLLRPTAWGLDVLLGFTAGVMLAATAFSLLVPALDEGGVGEVLLGFALGCACLLALDTYLPHAHQDITEHGRGALRQVAARRRATLLLSALTIHNVPEGLAVGVSFAAGGTDLGIPVALAIGIQNIPEGFAAAAPLLETGATPRRAAGVAALTGIVEPPAALLAYFTFELAGGLLPVGLGFAAGAMLYVVVDELIPESHGRGHERAASLALAAGFGLMMALDNAF